MSEPNSKILLTRRAALLGSAVGITLSGCSIPDLGEVIGPPPPLLIYRLRPNLTGGQAGPPVPWQLSIAPPEAAASLDTVRIALAPTPTTMDYFADASWADRLPILLQGLLLEAFANTGRVATARDSDGVATDYVLHTELREFQAAYSGDSAPQPDQPSAPPQVRVEINARLVANSDRRIIGGVNVVESAAAASNDLNAIVAAFNQALGVALSRTVDWCLRTLA